MLTGIVVLLFAIGIGTVIWIRNSKKHQIRERGWALLILILGTSLIMASLMRVPIAKPTDWISAIFSPVYKPIMKWLEEDM